MELARLLTPLHKLREDPVESGCGMWFKRDDLTGIELSGNKVRKLEYLVEDALNQNAGVLITCGGAQSNHARATALSAVRAGLQSHLILRGNPTNSAAGNLLLSRLAGATITWVTPEEYKTRETVFRKLETSYKTSGITPYSIPEGGSNALGVYGYLDCYREIMDQCSSIGIKPEFVYVAIGSGGTFAGLQAGWELGGRKGPKPVGIPVCDDGVFFTNKINTILNDFSSLNPEFTFDKNAFEMCDGFVGDGYALSRPEELSTIVNFARREALILDPVYTVKAYLGALAHRRQGDRRERPAIFVHTGGLFGLYGLCSDLQLDT